MFCFLGEVGEGAVGGDVAEDYLVGVVEDIEVALADGGGGLAGGVAGGDDEEAVVVEGLLEVGREGAVHLSAEDHDGGYFAAEQEVQDVFFHWGLETADNTNILSLLFRCPIVATHHRSTFHLARAEKGCFALV